MRKSLGRGVQFSAREWVTGFLIPLASKAAISSSRSAPFCTWWPSSPTTVPRGRWQRRRGLYFSGPTPAATCCELLGRVADPFKLAQTLIHPCMRSENGPFRFVSFHFRHEGWRCRSPALRYSPTSSFRPSTPRCARSYARPSGCTRSWPPPSPSVSCST